MGALRDRPVRRRAPEGGSRTPTPVDAAEPGFAEVPAIALCARCGAPDCAGHDFEASGERPILRTFAWEDGETSTLKALWRTSMASAADLELWVRASRPAEHGVAPAFTFALGCEVAAVLSTCGPFALLGSIAAWNLTHRWSSIATLCAVAARIGLVFVPLMMVIHVVHQVSLARAGAKRGKKVASAYVMRAGLYACGWDLATGPAGIVASVLSGEWGEARRRIRGNSTLFRDANGLWLERVHGVEGVDAERARRASTPWMIMLLVVAVVAVGWAVVASV